METLNIAVNINAQGTLTNVFDDHARLFDMTLGSSLTDYIHLNDRIIFLSFLADLRQNEWAEPISIRWQAIDKTLFIPAQLSCSSHDGDSFGLSIAIQEHAISDINKSVKPSQDMSKDINMLLAQAAHEMRTPLNAILGFADLLTYNEENHQNSQKRYDYIEMIKRAGEHLLMVVNNTLQQAENAHSKTDMSQSCLDDILSETIAWTTPLHGKRSFVLQSWEHRLLCRVDDVALRQICYNLISNALKYTSDTGQIHITVDCCGDGYACLTISDNGIGIPKQVIEQIGQPFLRAPNAVSLNIEGSGMGLAVVHDLVKKHHGDISFQENLQNGTCVCVRLPLFIATAEGASLQIKPNPHHLNAKTELRNNGNKTQKHQKQNQNLKTA